LRLARVAVDAVCKSSLQFVHERAVTKSVKLRTHIDPDAGWLTADELRLKQILVNLLTNAVKFTPSGGTVGLDVVAVPDRGVVRFEVWDTGIGIAPEDVDKLFERFTQLSSGLTRNFEGVGLGLSLAKRLTQLHGGHVEVESVLGKGTRFIVTLPFESHDYVAAPSVARREISAESDRRQRDATILVVDDNVASLALRNEYLTTFGYRVLQAQDGAGAIKMALAETPDLIIMDIQMPGMDGITAIREMRSHRKLERVPVIAQTALAMPGDEERCMQAGASVYLVKPTRMQTLLNEIDRLLNC
jgi:CheY-like chemotaxis protein/anti-sigma regulatory factor (Ser/Thr protein kinase)